MNYKKRKKNAMEETNQSFLALTSGQKSVMSRKVKEEILSVLPNKDINGR